MAECISRSYNHIVFVSVHVGVEPQTLKINFVYH